MNDRPTLRGLSIAFLVLGLLLIASGHYAYRRSRQHPTNKLPRVVLRIVPGWSLLIMGWTGLAITGVYRKPEHQPAPRQKPESAPASGEPGGDSGGGDQGSRPDDSWPKE